MSKMIATDANCGNEVHIELRDVPSEFVNGIRRILLADIPTVVLRDVEILENTTQFPHELLKHRVEMLPVNVVPSDTTTLRDAKVELRLLPAPTDRTITTADFVVSGGAPTLMMGDRDIPDTPLLFCYARPNEVLHIKAGLSVETKTASQVCVATMSYHVDPERAKEALKDPNPLHIQRCYSRDADGRPNWIDLDVESVGVIPARTLVLMAVKILEQRVDDYVEAALGAITRLKDNEYVINLPLAGHTELAVFQRLLYEDKNVNMVSYDVLHPLKPDTRLRIQTTHPIEMVLKTANTKLKEYCSSVNAGLGVRAR
jgi:DNA-directed RNA polymerase subunit L